MNCNRTTMLCGLLISALYMCYPSGSLRAITSAYNPGIIPNSPGPSPEQLETAIQNVTDQIHLTEENPLVAWAFARKIRSQMRSSIAELGNIQQLKVRYDRLSMAVLRQDESVVAEFSLFDPGYLVYLAMQPNYSLISAFKEALNNFEFTNKDRAERFVKLIPNSCPFAREVKAFGKTIVNIPPLCKINPLYEEIMMLKFRTIEKFGFNPTY